MNARNPLLVALTIQALVFPLALGLAWLLGVTPLADFPLTFDSLLLALAGTLPPILVLLVLHVLDPPWFREIAELVRPAVAALFHRQHYSVVIIVALLAGFGEELLFRGVLQAWLAGSMNPGLAILIAALLFGLLHYLSRAYFIYATLLGIYLGVIYQVTGNLLAICLIHALYDWVAIHYLLHRTRGTGST